ncbi:translation initiation factor IF-2 [Meiothermus taiwanensis]|jgi:translation initiation factor IF-2|uniref:Translation initiation factor IF-2 n=2 Tax=Meiothermus taiwanensis TaxID=172827 RepID=A0A399E3S7_9DEIN|nr:translation initiation factor IF-2 [Meiothermus taiwanensis]AWR86278.1 translation initiation factor IF-2 [Meiothermus taiwanensis WR-220]KIQ54277.1 translation initiation factor IF-2 [Meiothermus taiwanensis]KZK14865.1 translation initiation factor IF-2 [Meiothermus taiwanensis]RIH77330.1 Translation initiation factor IF-2 [Meiothermus taiwanensis]
MAKIRIYQLAKELEMSNDELLKILDDMGVTYKSHASTLEEDTALAVKELIGEQKVAEAARKAEEARKSIPHRPPVVVIMGHVDHGKTSLLDYLRKSRIAEKEAGGITQHVGAFEVKTAGGTVVFIDTPGHEAFTTIRQRGAKVADIAVIVIAATEGVMPQTKEAIAHAKASGAKIIFAANKMDLPGADINKVYQDLMQLGLVPVAYGGDVEVLPISAKTGQGVADLLETILLMAELEDLRADPKAEAQGVILEARVDKQAGVLVSLLVQQGTLKIGDYVVAGECWGKIKAMSDADGNRRTEAGPGSAVQVLGFSELPSAGETFTWVPDQVAAKEITEERIEERKASEARGDFQRARSLADLMRKVQQDEQKEINLILRADTQGSLEAIQNILAKEATEEVKINVLLAAVGAPTESDVLLASTANGAILSFSVNPSSSVKKAAEQKGVPLQSFRIIYDLIDEIRKMVKGQREPVYKEEILGTAEVRAIFKLSRGVIAGCMVTSGKITRSADIRVLRKGKEIWKGKIAGLKRLKDDVREVAQGFECGILLDGFADFQEGDILEASQQVEVATD